MRHYELMVILDPDVEERTVGPALDQFLTVVKKDGGDVEKVDIWGRRRMSFEIKKKAEGIYAVGNLVDDPELRFTPSGAAVAKFRMASTPRFLDKQTNEWKDGESLFLTCNVWRQAAENVAESLQRGMRVIVQGRLKQRSYETKEGEKRTVYEVEVDEVGPSLRSATAKVNKTQRGGGGGGFGGGAVDNDPWASAAPAAPASAGSGSGGGGGGWNAPGTSDEPPF